MSFFKVIDGQLVEAPNFVYGSGYELQLDAKDTYTYPVDEWYWYDTIEEARSKLIKTTRVTRAQAKLALLQLGLLDNLEAVMAAPNTPRAYKIAWQDALYFDRFSPTIEAVSAVLSLTAQQVDEIFQIAGTIDGF